MATSGRFLRLRYAGTCRTCGAAVARGERAWWDGSVECATCHGEPGAGSDVGPIDRGEAGRSATAEYRRRHAAREQRIDERWGPFAGVVKALAADPQPTTAWRTGADGERRVGEALERSVGGSGVVLHDRRVPGTRDNIDHLVVVPSGVWVVDSKHYAGRVARRDVGGWFRPDVRLFVGRRDLSKAVAGVHWQVDVVETELGAGALGGGTPAGESPPVVQGALCFVDAGWPWFAKPFRLEGIWVTWPKVLGTMLAAAGTLDRDRIDAVAALLAHRLRPA